MESWGDDLLRSPYEGVGGRGRRARRGSEATIQGTFAEVYSFQLRPIVETCTTSSKLLGATSSTQKSAKSQLYSVHFVLYFQDEGNWVAVVDDQEGDRVREGLELVKHYPAVFSFWRQFLLVLGFALLS